VQSERRGSRGANRVEEVPPAEKESDGQEAERRFARRVARVTPMATLVAAAIVGTLTSIGPAILVLAGGALFATIGFFWASMRTLGGDAPLADGFDTMTRRRVEASDSPAERKRAALRALKDLEFEHSIGKIDDADYLELSTRYRNTAKAIMREMDEGLAPRRKQAETLVESYLSKRGFSATPDEPDEPHEPHDKGDRPTAAEETLASAAPPPAKIESPRVTCSKCGVSNEPDAAFCKKCGAPLATEASATADKVDASV
jgi:hypothetical protein